MDQGLLIFIICVAILIIAVIIFELYKKGMFRRLTKPKAKSIKAKPEKIIKKENKPSGSISYWKFILSISASIILSIVIIYAIILLVKLFLKFNLLQYILS